MGSPGAPSASPRARSRILLVDDHTLFREGLKSLLRESAAFEVAGEAGNVAEALEMAAQARPDVILMDIALPDGNGLEATKTILGQNPDAKVVVISMYSKMEYVMKALQAGAAAFLVKDTTPDVLLHALEAVKRGHRYFDPTVTDEVVHFLLERHVETPEGDERYDRLTKREQEILRLVAEGLSTKQIASKLCISPKTVENHRVKVMDKLGVEKLVDLVKYAAKLGIIKIQG